MARPKSFYEVLGAAIKDVSEHGFDSQKRINDWMKALKDAAEAMMQSQRTMERMLRDALAAIYKRLIDNGQIAKLHPGVAKFTIQKLKPSLRASWTAASWRRPI